ncbi:MAG: hypothetical protein MK052_08245 [Alphaproteobacteria bacterium]|nr:hypothetical protein [Alphaproteobacteria bacterium]
MSKKTTQHSIENKKREETRAKLKKFLQSGNSDDVSSVLVHTLMHHADSLAEAKDQCTTPQDNVEDSTKD